MDLMSLLMIALSSLFFLLILFLIVRVILENQKKRFDTSKKGTSQVGFIVDTFHDLVSQLKEKEKELDELRKTAEERASAIELYNENIFQSVPSGVVSFDKELMITKMNSSAEKILELKGSSCIGAGFREVFNEPITEIIAEKDFVERAEVAYLSSCGKRIWLGLNLSPLKDSSNNVIGKILVFTDLTELKAFQSQMELRERLSNLGEMSAGIAHELRNPMAVISGYTKILSKKVDRSLSPAVDAIAKEVTVMDRIIADFLSFAKPTDLIVSEVDLNKLIAGCIDSLTVGSGDVRISLTNENRYLIKADEVLLRQSILNILQNAVEAMPNGGELRIALSHGDRLNMTFSDTGHGIAASIIDKIFLPFYTTKERGTGLGLSIVHKTIVSHGGVIQVSSGEGGTTFSVSLPLNMIISRGKMN